MVEIRRVVPYVLDGIPNNSCSVLDTHEENHLECIGRGLKSSIMRLCTVPCAKNDYQRRGDGVPEILIQFPIGEARDAKMYEKCAFPVMDA